MEKDLVSVIMPTYNDGEFLSASIDGILNQTYKNLELIITDDASTNQVTLDILHRYAQKDERIHVQYLPENRGAAGSRNASIKRAKGRYIAFCDSDDIWFPEKLEKQIDYMKAKGCALSCTSYILIDEENQVCGIRISPQHITFSMEKRDNKIGCSTAIYDTEAFGGKVLMPSLKKRQDWGLFLTLLQSCHVAFGVQRPLAYYRIRSHSVSSNKLNLVKYNLMVYTQVLGFSKMKAWAYFFTLFLPTYFFKRRRRKNLKKKYDDNITRVVPL